MMVQGWLGIKHHGMLQIRWMEFHGPEHGLEIDS